MEQRIGIFKEGEIRLLSVEKLIARNSWTDKNIGLLRGKMGDVLFYYKLDKFYSSSENSSDFLNLAKSNLDDIFNQLSLGKNDVDFSNGLSGIGYIINVLIENKYEEGDVDDILEDVDDTIFRNIAHASKIPIDFDFGILGFLAYLIPRVKKGSINSIDNRDFTFKRLLILLINLLGDAIVKDPTWFREPSFFKITWNLPLCLKLLADARELNVYNYKIDKLLALISENALSIYPNMHSNRLSLLVGIKYIIVHDQTPRWQSHAKALKAGIDLDYILYEELKDKNIELINGVSGIYWLLKEYNQMSNPEDSFNIKSKRFIERVINSSYWIEQKTDNDYLKYNYSLLEGLSGIGLTLMHILYSKPPRKI